MATGLLPIAHSLSALPRSFFTSLQSPPSSSSSPLISGSLHFVPRVYNFTADAHDRTSKWPASLNIVREFHKARALRDSGLAVLDYSFDDGKEDLPAVEEGLEISKLGFAKEIVSALARKGITKLFPIQRAVLEPAMQGRDMVGRARTGTGKTLAFGIPILDKIIRLKEKQRRRRNPLAIVLAPTRELARQVEKEFSEAAPSVETLCVYGGAPIQRQMSTLDRGVDVVVGTPGRLIDLLNRGSLNLSEVQFVVLDEADQMLNVGFAEDVETILEHIRQAHQTMMFSATMPSWILKLTRRFLKNPVNIDLVGDSDQKLADGISLYSIASETHEKSAIIGPLITEHAKGGKCIVFTKTKRDADRLASFMSRSFKCEALHGDISQSQRERTLSRFRDGRFNILVATDVASRGLDVPNVDLVVHYELPNSSEIFVHRSGRTGRAGKKGSAILMHSSRQHRDVKGIGQEVGCRFTELPKIAAEGGTIDMFDDYGGNGGSHFGGSRFSSPSIDRFGSREKSGSTGYGGAYSGRSSSYGGPPSSEGRFKGSNAGRSGSSSGFRSGRSDSSSSGFKSGRSGGYGNSRGSERQGGYGNFGGSDRSSSFENSRGYGNSRGSERQGGYGNFGGSDRSSGFENFGGSSKSGSSDGNGSFNPGRKSRSSLFDDLFDDDKIGGSKSGSAFF